MTEKIIEVLLGELSDLNDKIDDCLREEHHLTSNCNYGIELERANKHYLKLKLLSKGIVSLRATIHHHMAMATLRISYYVARLEYIQTTLSLDAE